MRTCRKEAGDGQSYAHCRWAGESYAHRPWAGHNPLHVNKAHGVRVHFLIVTIPIHNTLAVLRSEDTKARSKPRGGGEKRAACLWKGTHVTTVRETRSELLSFVCKKKSSHAPCEVSTAACERDATTGAGLGQKIATRHFTYHPYHSPPKVPALEIRQIK